jgi:hypothetical protein
MRAPSRDNFEARMRKSVDGHKFRIGQTVSLASGFGYSQSARAVFKIVALLPSNGAHFQYRIRNSGELFERVAAENELMLRQSF